MRGKLVATLAVAGALAVPAAAQAQPAVVVGGGLVNVQVVDVANNVLSNNNVGVGVAAGIAAQVCGLNAQVGVIAEQLARNAPFTCTNSAGTQRVNITQLQ